MSGSDFSLPHRDMALCPSRRRQARQSGPPLPLFLTDRSGARSARSVHAPPRRAVPAHLQHEAVALVWVHLRLRSLKLLRVELAFDCAQLLLARLQLRGPTSCLLALELLPAVSARVTASRTTTRDFSECSNCVSRLASAGCALGSQSRVHLTTAWPTYQVALL